MSKGSVDRPWRRRCLRQGKVLELSAQAGDLALALARAQRIARSGECASLLRAEHTCSDGPLVGGQRRSVTLGHLRALSCSAEELLLGEEKVGEDPIELPDPVEHGELGIGVKAEVADELADVGPVLVGGLKGSAQ